MVVLVLVAALVGLPTPTTAAPTSTTRPVARRTAPVEKQIRTLREQVEEASEEEAALLDRLEEAEARRKELEAGIVELDRRIAEAQAELDAAEARLAEVEADLSRTEARLADAEQQLAVAKAELQQRAVAAYVGQPTMQVADVMLRMRSVHDLAAGQGYLDAVVEAQAKAVARYRALRDEIVRLRGALELTVDEARAQRNVVRVRKTSLEQSRVAQEDLRRQAADEEGRHVALLEEVRGRVAEFEARILALQAESELIAAFLQSLQTGQAVVGGVKGRLGLPVASARVTSAFGPRVHPVLGTVRLHAGLDFGAAHDTPIRAAADGVVASAAVRGGYGNAVIIDHGDSLATLYAHQSRMLVAEGQRVRRGQVIGAVGSTGMSTGPHLHFEVRLAGTPVDPVAFL